MGRLLSLGELLLVFVPFELLPDAINLLRVAPHHKFTGGNEHYLSPVHKVGAIAGIRTMCHVRSVRLYVTRCFTLTRNQRGYQEEHSPAAVKPSRHFDFH
jgi:hypothetical protein